MAKTIDEYKAEARPLDRDWIRQRWEDIYEDALVYWRINRPIDLESEGETGMEDRTKLTLDEYDNESALDPSLNREELLDIVMPLFIEIGPE
jgi:hypothetical protein